MSKPVRKCPKCGQYPYAISEVIDCVKEYCPDDNGFINDEWNPEVAIDATGKATGYCKCGHVWRLRGIFDPQDHHIEEEPELVISEDLKRNTPPHLQYLLDRK